MDAKAHVNGDGFGAAVFQTDVDCYGTIGLKFYLCISFIVNCNYLINLYNLYIFSSQICCILD